MEMSGSAANTGMGIATGEWEGMGMQHPVPAELALIATPLRPVVGSVERVWQRANESALERCFRDKCHTCGRRVNIAGRVHSETSRRTCGGTLRYSASGVQRPLQADPATQNVIRNLW